MGETDNPATMTTPASSIDQALTRASYDATPYESLPLVRQQPRG